MNKYLKNLSYFALALSFLVGCSGNQSAKNIVTNNEKQNNDKTEFNDSLSKGNVIAKTNDGNNAIDSGALWLKNIFQCKNTAGFCFYLAKEKQLCTPRFYDFMTDSEELFGASNLTEEDYPETLKIYKEKWGKIYPLRTETEPFLFGRGNDDMENIKEVKISKISDLNYLVFVDFGEDIKTNSKVKLTKKDKDFKIDYCETTFL
ncbi:MAG: hypothetical protein ABIP95_11825 [Pelobium sp.]